jgi:hypothetical protein
MNRHAQWDRGVWDNAAWDSPGLVGQHVGHLHRLRRLRISASSDRATDDLLAASQHPWIAALLQARLGLIPGSQLRRDGCGPEEGMVRGFHVPWSPDPNTALIVYGKGDEDARDVLVTVGLTDGHEALPQVTTSGMLPCGARWQAFSSATVVAIRYSPSACATG